MIRRIVKKVSIIFILAIMLVCNIGFSFSIKAEEQKKVKLPKGWRYLNTKSLSNKMKSDLLQRNSYLDDISLLRAPAPGLTSLEIIDDLALDNKNEIHVVTREIGTSKPGLRIVHWSGGLCKENIYETIDLVGSNGIVYGYIRFFHTGLYESPELKGTVATVEARSTNAMRPWNILRASAVFHIE